MVFFIELFGFQKVPETAKQEKGGLLPPKN
jgi:hypothetical protein